MGTIDGGGEYGVGDSHRVSETNHGEAGAAEGRWDVGDSKGGSSEGSGSNPVLNDLHWNKTDDCGTVGDTAEIFRCMRKGDGL